PRFICRNQVVAPRYDTRSLSEIIKGLADRVGIGQYFPYNSTAELQAWQLEPTGVKIEDFAEKGFVELSREPIMYDRQNLDGRFKTPSGKIEIISQKLTEAGLPSLKPYESPEKPPKGKFRLVFGRSAVHAHAHTINNPLLHELMPENTLWVNRRAAARMGVKEGDWVEVSSNGMVNTIKAHVTDFIHPEAVYMVHGFGRQVPLQTRSYHAGVGDQKLMKGMLTAMDPAGGGLCLCECMVTVKRSSKNPKRMVEL
ncbi:MAG TPA: thiosulfate reductase, partial [Desulfobacteraceae bacterium]|nr:thiosulfate reductase [Desulfobacteraceae bacterium]